MASTGNDSGRKYYTEARLANARRNLDRYDWARALRDECLAKAERWAAYSDGKLQSLVVPPEVPRTYDVHNLGCPVHGVKANEKGFYQWGIDFDRPFKVRCPHGDEEYPSNDFEAFLASGMRDRSLLTGPCADDGWGWHRPGDDRDPANYWFVAYYTHWSMARFMREALENLGMASVLSDDPERAARYARKCALILHRLAERYPDYVYEKQSREGKEHNPNYTGKLFNHIWEVWTPNTCAPAYDAIRPFLLKDPELTSILGKTPARIDEEIRERLLREAARSVLDGSRKIAGNYGMHQKSLILLARVLEGDEKSPTSREMLRFVTENPDVKVAEDMGLRDALENLVYRDGMPRESPGYNFIWVNEITDIAAALGEEGIPFFRNPRFQKLLLFPTNARVAGSLLPSLGDSGDMFSVAGKSSAESYLKALPYLQDPRLVWAARSGDAGARDLFGRAVEELLAEIPDVDPPEIGLKTFHFPAYGLALLQSGAKTNPTAACLFYSSHVHHMHHDQLNLMLFSHGNVLLSDIGYPEQTDAFNYRRYGYFDNTIAHNTVVVDGVKQSRGPGVCHAFEPNGFVQVADASCEGAYPGRVELYRRANLLVDAAPGKSYLFDAFYVRGGSRHDFSLHGTQADFTCDPPLGEPRREGTLAGPEVPYEQFYDDAELKDKALGTVPYTRYRGSGYQFLTGVRRRPLEGAAIGDWRLTEPKEGQPERPWKGIGLRAHMVGDGEEILSCDGPVQHYRHLPESVKYLIRRREGDALSSRFVTVFEPYRDDPWIRTVKPVAIDPDDGEAAAALVELEDGSRHYLFHSLHSRQACLLDGKVRVLGQAACLVLDRIGKPVRAALLNGAELRYGEFSLSGKGLRRSRIISVDYANGIVGIADPILDGDLRPGQSIRVVSPGSAECLTVHRRIDPSRISIGDEDLRVAGGPIREFRAAEREIVTGVPNPHAKVGMTVLNSLGIPQGRLAERTASGWRLDGSVPLGAGSFPRADGDAVPRFSVVVAGPGDEVWIPHLAEYGVAR